MYGHFKDEAGNEYGSYEVFYVDGSDTHLRDEEDQQVPAGWYWWACFPGCLPDGGRNGPFVSYAEAINAAEEA